MAIVWHIPLCKHCPKRETGCIYKVRLRESSKQFPILTHVTHNCPEYKKLFQYGQRVKVTLYYREPDDEYGAVWEIHSTALGTITSKIHRKKLWEVQLDKTVKLMRYSTKQLPYFQEVTYVNCAKPANKIEIIEGEFGTVREPDFGEFDEIDTW